jgi:hypothetical protein
MKKRNSFFKKQITVYKWRLSLFSTGFFLLGTIFGFYLVLSNIIPLVFAETATSVSKTTDTDFSEGTLTDLEVSGSGSGAVVRLSGGGGEDWYNGSWQYRKKITIDKDNVDADLTNFPIF